MVKVDLLVSSKETGWFKPEVQDWAKRAGVKLREMHLRSMMNEGGSWLSNGRVTFNTDVAIIASRLRERIAGKTRETVLA